MNLFKVLNINTKFESRSFSYACLVVLNSLHNNYVAAHIYKIKNETKYRPLFF